MIITYVLFGIPKPADTYGWLLNLIPLKIQLLRGKEVSALITQEQFDNIANQYGCGYWHVCDDHACGCSPSAAVSQGFNPEVYNSMSKKQQEYNEQIQKEIDEYNFFYDFELDEEGLEEYREDDEDFDYYIDEE